MRAEGRGPRRESGNGRGRDLCKNYLPPYWSEVYSGGGEGNEGGEAGGHCGEKNGSDQKERPEQLNSSTIA